MGGKNVKNTIVGGVLSTIAPDYCYGCDFVGEILCERCAYNIETEPFSGCVLCLSPLTDISGVCGEHEAICEAAWVVGWRQEVLQAVVGAFKFERKQQAASVLARLIDARLPLLPAETVIVPVPTRPAHIRRRGYDHMTRLATAVGAIRGYEVQPLVATRADRAQHLGDKRQRAEQAQSAFSLRWVPDVTRPHLILDDIVTTGATMTSMAQLLRTSGVRTVWLAALARQPLD